MGWITGLVIDGKHRCVPPVRTVTGDGTYYYRVPDGHRDGLWRCDHCRKLWRVGRACDVCDAWGHHPYGGQCLVGNRWRHARLGQRLRHWRSS